MKLAQYSRTQDAEQVGSSKLEYLIIQMGFRPTAT